MKGHLSLGETTVRNAHEDDVEALASLSGQFGYLSSEEQVLHRFDDIQLREDHCVYVCEDPNGQIMGWVHVFVRPLLISERSAEIGGMVVDRSRRGEGVGRLLMSSAEAWAREQGCGRLVVRSNSIRKDAHAFYQSLGFETVKTQRIFSRNLSEANPP